MNHYPHPAPIGLQIYATRTINPLCLNTSLISHIQGFSSRYIWTPCQRLHTYFKKRAYRSIECPTAARGRQKETSITSTIWTEGHTFATYLVDMGDTKVDNIEQLNWSTNETDYSLMVSCPSWSFWLVFRLSYFSKSILFCLCFWLFLRPSVALIVAASSPAEVTELVNILVLVTIYRGIPWDCDHAHPLGIYIDLLDFY